VEKQVDTDLEFKALSGQLNVDEAKGIVECFVAAVGNKDSVGDVVVSGAFNNSLNRRKPRVVWGHDWNQPIGKVLEIYEVGPKDARLPAKMREAGVGGVYAKVQFNLKSERGREAFNSVMFFGEDQEWSIGYKTLDSIYSPERQANLLKEVELYEVSPVLHGANQLTATISIKSATGESSRITSFRKSKWGTFDLEWAQKLKEEHPDIWAKGGNIRGNDQWEILSKIHRNGGTAETEDQIKALELREAWVARHEGDFRLPGVIAQIKWLAVGSRGEGHMKDVVREAIAKKEMKKKTDDYKGYGYEKDEEEEYDSSEDDPIEELDRIAMREEMGDGDEMSRRAVLAGALANELRTPVRIRTMTGNTVIFDVKDEDEGVATMRASWHAERGQVMIGKPEMVRVETVYIPMDDGEGEAYAGDEESMDMEDLASMKGPGCGCGGKGGCGGSMKTAEDGLSLKAPIPADAIPQERITGDVLRGYGPRRGNLERLLRYWRPIMRKPGGFRRCRVILANHPELYPLSNICAWLHHETTGLWPNEGCHHPGMKNCRRKLRGVTRGSLWSDSEFDARLNRLNRGKKDAYGSEKGHGGWVMPERDEEMPNEMAISQILDFNGDGEITEDDLVYAMRVLSGFMSEEKEFVDYLREEKNWVHEGMDDEGKWKMYEPEAGWSMKSDCGCGEKSDDEDDFDSLIKSVEGILDLKVGRSINARNLGKIRQAIALLQDTINGLSPEEAIEMKSDGFIQAPIENLFAIRETLDPVVEYYGLDVEVTENGVHVKDFSDLIDEAKSAIESVVVNFDNIQTKGIGRSIGNAIGRGRSAGRFVPRDGDNDGKFSIAPGEPDETPISKLPKPPKGLGDRKPPMMGRGSKRPSGSKRPKDRPSGERGYRSPRELGSRALPDDANERNPYKDPRGVEDILKHPHWEQGSDFEDTVALWEMIQDGIYEEEELTKRTYGRRAMGSLGRDIPKTPRQSKLEYLEEELYLDLQGNLDPDDFRAFTDTVWPYEP
jgi:HK97 family phage prohead protease